MNFSKKNHELIPKNENNMSKTQKQHLNDKLQKSSVLFLQLGLVLALFFVYTALEYESIKKEFPLAEVVPDEPQTAITNDVIFTIERKKVQKSPKERPQTNSTEVFTKVPDTELTPEQILEPVDPDEPTINEKINSLPGDDTLTPDPDEIIDFKVLEEVPVFPGCEGLEKEASKQCFAKGISKFVNKKFNTDIAETLNAQGKQKIWVEFKIDKKGMVTDIKARSPYKKLEKEAIRVVKKLPQMTPGKQRTKPVNVKYTLPIIFQVY